MKSVSNNLPETIWQDVLDLIEKVKEYNEAVQQQMNSVDQLKTTVTDFVTYFQNVEKDLSKEVIEEISIFIKHLDKEFVDHPVKQMKSLIADSKAIQNLLNDSTKVTLKEGESSKEKIILMISSIDKSSSQLFESLQINNPLRHMFIHWQSTLDKFSAYSYEYADKIITNYCPELYNFHKFINELKDNFVSKQVIGKKDKPVYNLEGWKFQLGAILILQSYISIMDAVESNLPFDLSLNVGGSIAVQAEAGLKVIKPWLIWAPVKITAEVLEELISTYADLPSGN